MNQTDWSYAPPSSGGKAGCQTEREHASVYASLWHNEHFSRAVTRPVTDRTE